MKPQYERISWGWIAYVFHNGYLYRGRGETKRAAKAAIRTK